MSAANVLWDRCPRCRTFLRDPLACRCQLFQAQNDWSHAGAPFTKPPEDGNWSDVYAQDAEAAAEKFAEDSDSDGDYTIVRRGSGDVWVRDCENNVTCWSIEAESVPTYNATEVKR